MSLSKKPTRAISAAKRIAKAGGGSAGMMPHPAGIAFRHLEKRGDAVSLAVGGPATARALQLARRNNQSRPYQLPNELSHDPPDLFDAPYHPPFARTNGYDDGGDVGDTADMGPPTALRRRQARKPYTVQ